MKNKQMHPSGKPKKIYALTEKRPIDVSLSENPLGCSPQVLRALRHMETTIHHYPSPNGRMLKQKLAIKLNMSVNNFFVASGSESIIQNIPRVFGERGTEAIIPALTFPLFKTSCELVGMKVVLSEMTKQLEIDITKVAQSVTRKTQLVFLCNPNNPTGNILQKQDIVRFVDIVPRNVLVIVDEANNEFGGESVIREVVKRENLIVLRTFSKGFGLASLRVGFAAAHPLLVQKLEAETSVFPVSGLSEKLASIALEDDRFVAQTKKFVSEERGALRTQLSTMGFIVFPSQANNLFVKTPKSVSTKNWVEGLKGKGISVVMGSSFDGFDDRFFRMSVRDKKTNAVFIQKLKELLDEKTEKC